MDDDFKKILIPIIRRVIPNTIANDIAGVQPMTGPSGIIFLLHSKYGKGIRAHKTNGFDDWLKQNQLESNKKSVDRYIDELENPDLVFL